MKTSSVCQFPHLLITKSIQLYGDRAGSKGNFRFAGLAWIQGEKTVFIQGDAQNLAKPAEWLRLHRLATLAHRLKKPMVLWNLPMVRVATAHPPASLALAHAIQKTELQLLKLPHPIVTVFDGTVKWDMAELAWRDGAVLMAPARDKGQVSFTLRDESTVSSMQPNLKIAAHTDELLSHLAALLRDLSAMPATKLIANRHESLRKNARVNSAPTQTEPGVQNV